MRHAVACNLSSIIVLHTLERLPPSSHPAQSQPSPSPPDTQLPAKVDRAYEAIGNGEDKEVMGVSAYMLAPL